MSLDLTKLEKVVELADGVKRARCPACAEGGSDRKGEHLRVYPDGKFGCCVFPQDREHRKRIFALAGDRGRQAIRVRVAAAKATGPVRSGILGRLGQVFGGPAAAYSTIGTPDAPDGVNEVGEQFEQPDGPDGVREVEPLSESGRTPRTGESNSDSGSEYTVNNLRTGRTGQTESNGELFGDSRTLRTPQYSLCVAQEGKEVGVEGSTCATLKEYCRGVRSVREQESGLEPPKTAESRVRLPFLTPGGTLSIPHDSPERYHWWKLDGQRLHVKEILAEVLARQEEAKNGASF
jgi:hypothetical protein